jgi:chemosensory pili system protein ChpA (sensor histidine kinase/response regulator)
MEIEAEAAPAPTAQDVQEASGPAPQLHETGPEIEVEAQPAAEADAGIEDEFDADSELLADSQLMTDSELLADSNLLISVSAAAAESGAVGALTEQDSKVVQFPTGDQFVEGDGFVARRPLPQEEPAAAAGSERVRVSSEVLDQMVNNAGEVSIYRARLEQQNSSFAFNLGELGQTTDRLRAQLRDLELETEAQILSRHERETDARSDFDPLELDRYSTIQQLSRALSETVEDLSNLQQSLSELSRDSDTLLLQQARVTTDLQDSLLRTRMVKFASRVPRLERVVRQTCHTLGKQARLDVVGGREDMDRAILERMMGPLEHLLRNSVSHGIEDVGMRQAKGKPVQGLISLHLAREGSDIVLKLSDDGAGLDRERIRAKAIDRGLLEASAAVEDDDLYQLILQPGFSTAQELSQVSGRGVGMDVVLTEVKQLGGTLEIASQPGHGTSFTIRLPFTLAITDSLLVTLGEDIYAVPHSSMDGVVRIPLEELRAIYAGEQEKFEYGGREYLVRYLGSMLGNQAPHLSEGARWLPLLLVHSGEHRVAIQVDGLLGNRQIVVKSVGAQLSTVRWFTGGTILADGQIALILDVNSLVRMDSAQQPAATMEAEAPLNKGVSVMVVDDSITVRKVTSRLLERHNMHVITAKDGVDAVTQLQEHHPDVVLLDIEMPRMDGYELARHMRSTPELSDIPIIMITSRTGDKHRNRAMELGVKRYLGKPYQEADLLENIYTVLADTAL